MKFALSQLRVPALGFLLTLPFIVLELWNQPVSRFDFPFSLFGFIWFLSSLFVLFAHFVVTALQTGNILARPVHFLATVSFLVLIALMWSGLMIDQLPCFMGVPNCD